MTNYSPIYLERNLVTMAHLTHKQRNTIAGEAEKCDIT